MGVGGGSYSRWSFFFASLRGEPLFFELACSVSTHKIKKPALKRKRTFLVPGAGLEPARPMVTRF